MKQAHIAIAVAAGALGMALGFSLSMHQPQVIQVQGPNTAEVDKLRADNQHLRHELDKEIAFSTKVVAEFEKVVATK